MFSTIRDDRHSLHRQHDCVTYITYTYTGIGHPLRHSIQFPILSFLMNCSFDLFVIMWHLAAELGHFMLDVVNREQKSLFVNG